MSVSNLDDSFMVYNETSKQISFINLSEANEGNYTVTITLEDLQGLSASYDIQFEFIAPEVEEQEDYDSVQDQPVYTYEFAPTIVEQEV